MTSDLAEERIIKGGWGVDSAVLLIFLLLLLLIYRR